MGGYLTDRMCVVGTLIAIRVHAGFSRGKDTELEHHRAHVRGLSVYRDDPSLSMMIL